MNNFSYIKANGVEDAMRAGSTGTDVRILAGGTDILPLIKDGIVSPDALIDISGWRDCSDIEEVDGGLLIGALAPLAAIASHPQLLDSYRALADACKLAATPQLRNMGTIGGNLLQQTRCWYYRGHHDCWIKGGQICFARDGENENHAIFMTDPAESKCVSAHPSDPGAALLALDASVVIMASGGEIEMPVADFFALPTDDRRTYTNLPEGALITGIKLPQPSTIRRSSYVKVMARATWAFALAGVALSANIDRGRVENARVARAGVAPIPFRVSSVERQISGRAVTDLDFEALGTLVVEGAA
ncbi:MAG: FAD binding domain-containing protein, partial [Chloroflexia bacterium]